MTTDQAWRLWPRWCGAIAQCQFAPSLRPAPPPPTWRVNRGPEPLPASGLNHRPKDRPCEGCACVQGPATGHARAAMRQWQASQGAAVGGSSREQQACVKAGQCWQAAAGSPGQIWPQFRVPAPTFSAWPNFPCGEACGRAASLSGPGVACRGALQRRCVRGGGVPRAAAPTRCWDLGPASTPHAGMQARPASDEHQARLLAVVRGAAAPLPVMEQGAPSSAGEPVLFTTEPSCEEITALVESSGQRPTRPTL